MRIQQRYETITNDALKVMTLTTTNVNAHPDYGTMRIDEGSNNVNAVNSLDTENICVRSAVLVGNSISTTIKQTINIGNDKKNEEISSVHSDNDRGSSNMQSYGDKDVESGLNNGNSVYSRKDKKYNGYPVATLQDPESEMQQNLISNIHTSHFKKNRIIGRRILSKYNSTDRMLLSDAYHFSIYALAMYSQLIMLYMHPFSGPCRLCGCCNPIVCRCMRGDVQSSSNSHTQPHIIGDNSCKTHRSAIEEILRLNNKLHHTDIYYLSMINTNVAKPYAIFIDHETQSVVVSIRYASFRR